MMALPIDQAAKVSKTGTLTCKHKLRAAFRATSFLGLIFLFSAANFLTNNDDAAHGRRLQEENVADPAWLLVFYIAGVLYMFLALAIVCDEYFVPALEVMSGDLHLNLTPDISGATLMAAGGSAPELFTSFIGTFQESEVGFGTIVGSAVFNVLFVIGMCSLLSKETLELTWWPLFRDSTYYAIGLLVLAIFVGIKGAEEIDLIEATILFAMYIGYIVIMSYNEKLYYLLTGKDLYPKAGDSEYVEMSPTTNKNLDFKHHTAFRAGLLTLLRQPEVWLFKARISLVSKISGNVDDAFDFVDEDGDGEISRDELRKFFRKMEAKDCVDEKSDVVTEEELDSIMADIDLNNDGQVGTSYYNYF